MARPTPEKLRLEFSKSVAHLQQGRYATAEKHLIRLGRWLPDSVAVWNNLGVCHQCRNNHVKAVPAFTRSLSIDAGQTDSWAGLGISHKELGQFDKAEQAARKALELDSGHARSLNLLGTIQAERKETAAARESFGKCLAAAPTDPISRINLALLEYHDGKADRARELIADMDAGPVPERRKFRILTAYLMISDGRFREAELLVDELERTTPEDEEILRLGIALSEAMVDHFGVILRCQRLLRRLPGDAGIWNTIANAYFQLQAVQEAGRCYEKAMSLEPDSAGYRSNLGLACAALGDRNLAESHYRRSLELNPDHTEAYRHLCALKRFSSADDPDARSVIDLWESDDLSDNARIDCAFALGKIYDDCGLYDQAFEICSIGNALRFRMSHVDLEAFFMHLDRIPETFYTAPYKTALKQPNICPVFIVGMPRSGTTLVEQILSRHSRVHGCGELTGIENAIRRLERDADPMRVYPDDFWDIDRDALEAEGRHYVSSLTRLHDIRKPFLTDKMPFNFTHVWLIRALFPDSPVIHCRRHPLDVILSNFFQLYESDISFVYDLQALSRYYVRYHRLMAHWKQVFPDGIHDVRYESLVGDVEEHARQLIAATGLEWEDRCLDPDASDTAVRTVSIWQVRREVYTSSRERWRNYADRLGVVVEILSEAGILDRNGNWLEQ